MSVIGSETVEDDEEDKHLPLDQYHIKKIRVMGVLEGVKENADKISMQNRLFPRWM